MIEAIDPQASSEILVGLNTYLSIHWNRYHGICICFCNFTTASDSSSSSNPLEL